MNNNTQKKEKKIHTIEKFRVTRDDKDYTIFPNFLLQNLKNAEALGLYVYFSSLPPHWEFHKDYLRRHFNIGRDKLEKLLRLLELSNLVQIHQERNANGKFIAAVIHVLCPRNFKVIHNSPLTDFQGTDKTPATSSFQPFTKTTVDGLPGPGKQQLEKKEIKKKQKSFYANAVDNSKKHEWAKKPEAIMASVMTQSTSYRPNQISKSEKVSPLLEEYIKKSH